jgi:hypothetical protein
MADSLAKTMSEMVRIADKYFDGHLTILKFSSGWKVIFGTIPLTPEGREEVHGVRGGVTLYEAACDALQKAAPLSQEE